MSKKRRWKGDEEKIEPKQERGIGLKKVGRQRQRENRRETGLYHPLTGAHAVGGRKGLINNN